MRRGVVIVLLVIASSTHAQSASTHIDGVLIAREIAVTSQPSWSEGAFGRFDVGANAPGDRDFVNVAIAHAGIDWAPKSWLVFHADGLARREPSGTKGKRAGLVQAYADLTSEHWRVRAGMFWLPTSRENVDPLWQSRYSITASALNTWIGEEVRPIGVDVQYDPNFYLSFGATAFGGNDTMGTAIASHGWTFGNRLTLYDEALPVGDAKTIPVERDLDDRLGHAERIRIKLPERAMLQVAHLDNRAKLVPKIDGQVPWLTRFNVVSGEIGSTSPTTLAAEWCYGWTALAFPGGSFTMNFDTAYVLLSHKRGSNRLTLRVDRFATSDRTHPDPDFAREHGRGLTVAWLHDVSKQVRLGIEYARATGDRRFAIFSGGDPRVGGHTITLELRRRFGS